MKTAYSKFVCQVIRHAVCMWVLQLSFTVVYGQQVDIENAGKNLKSRLQNKKPVKITGGINASTVFYQGNAGSGRDPFSYVVNGNVGISLYGISIPASFVFTNQGFSYNYNYPQLPNRLSLHPKYKWITGHIGDINTSFSPYTLNGMLVTGLGADLAPRKGNMRYSVIYGRLQKAVPFTPGNGNTLATYKRMGYGGKIMYDKGAYKAGISVFRAADVLNSLTAKPDSLQIYPQENTSVSLEGSVPLIKNLILKTEYGISVLTKDLRAPKTNDSAAVKGFIAFAGGRLSTSMYKALKTDLNYTIGSAMIGVGYERIDPGYQTLGAYFFNNDLENITVNFARALFKGKINVAGNLGMQRDDLDNNKSGGSSRRVGALNIAFVPNKKLTANINYSNFQTYTNVKPQFQYINQLTQFDNLDTLNFRQLSQNANASLNYLVSTNKDKPQSVNANLGFQDAYDMQGGIIVKGAASRFYNLATGYNFTNNPKLMNLLGAFNLTLNQTAGKTLLTLGPTVGMNKKLFKKAVTTGVSISYNQTASAGQTLNNTTAFRMNAGYVWKKKHNIGLNSVGMLRQSNKLKKSYDFTETLTYSYSFK